MTGSKQRFSDQLDFLCELRRHPRISEKAYEILVGVIDKHVMSMTRNWIYYADNMLEADRKRAETVRSDAA